MNYTLMHKRIPVAELELDSPSAAITKILETYHPEHLPVGVRVSGEADRAALNNWWRKRAIPASRDGLRNALWELGDTTPEELLEKCFGLSLSDQYWICPADSGLTWDDVNFFDNPFSEDVGNILLGRPASGSSISLMSPDNSSDGWLRKKWAILDGKRCLLKGGSGTNRQEPYNEVLASRIAAKLQIPCVSYQVIYQHHQPFSVCDDFITPDTELISVYHILNANKKPNHLSFYQHILNCCEGLGVTNAELFLNQMITLDFLIANEDRHFNNFGLIRNAETLEYLGMAPIFDSGTSLWYNTPDNQIRPRASMLPSKPFKPTHTEQIKLVTSFDWLDLDVLRNIDGEFREILTDSETISSHRAEILCSALKQRVELLGEIVQQRNPTPARVEEQPEADHKPSFRDNSWEPEI